MVGPGDRFLVGVLGKGFVSVVVKVFRQFGGYLHFPSGVEGQRRYINILLNLGL